MGKWVIWIGFAVSACAGAGTGAGDGPDASLGKPDVVDDLEDGDDAILASGGRVGTWYTFHDATATGVQMPPEAQFKPAAGGADGSKFAAETSGMGFTDWGAGMGFDLDNTGTTRGTYDGSKYQVLAFKAKGNVTVRLTVEIAGTVPMADGGTCIPSTTMGMECEDMHGTTIQLTADWKEYEVKLSDLRQEGWGKVVPFDAKSLIAVAFQVDPKVAFDVAVDDVRFYE